VRLLVLLAHPDPGSFNHAIAQRAAATARAAGHEVQLRDLCRERFPAVLPAHELPRDGKLDAAMARHCREAAGADGFIVVHPDWWGMPPAILVGWVDRVLRPGVAYDFVEGDGGEGVPRGLLRAKSALVFNTSNTSARRERAVFGDPLQRIWGDCVFGLCGVREVKRRMFRTVVTSTQEQRRRWLDEVERVTKRCFPPEKGKRR
jgi:NAD(P)H dehydrogenase (quinone)